MKKLYLILAIMVAIIPSTFIAGVGWDMYDPLPVITTDKESYFPNENIQVNSSWNILFEDPLEIEIVIILTNYSLELNPLNVAVTDAINQNLSISCPVQNGVTIFETKFDCIDIDPGPIWVNLIYLTFRNGEFYSMGSYYFSKSISIQKYDITTSESFPEVFEIIYGDMVHWNSNVFAEQNNSIIFPEESIKIEIIRNDTLIYNFNQLVDNSGNFSFSFSSFQLNSTGYFTIKVIFEKNSLFNNKYFLANLSVLDKNLNFISLNASNISLFTHSSEFMLQFQLKDNQGLVYFIEDLDIFLNSDMNLIDSFRYNLTYSFVFQYPDSEGTYNITLSGFYLALSIAQFTGSYYFQKNHLNLTLRLRELDIDNNISFYIEENSTMSLIELNKTMLSIEMFDLESWIPLNYTVLYINYNKFSVIVDWDDVVNDKDVNKKSYLLFRLKFEEDRYFYNYTSQNLTVALSLYANFSLNQFEIVEGQKVYFNFTGIYPEEPITFYWDFGDETYSTQENPEHYYESPGIYSVSLRIEDITGNSDTFLQNDILTVVANEIPVAIFNITYQYLIQNEFLLFYFTGFEGNGPARFLWDFGDGTSSDSREPEKIFENYGSFNVTLEISDFNGEMANFSKILTIGRDYFPSANFQTEETDIVKSQIVHFTFTGSEGNGPAKFYWDFGDGTNSTLKNPTKSYENPGKFTIKLVIIDFDGDSTLFSKILDISPKKTTIPIITFVIFGLGANIYIVRKKKKNKLKAKISLNSMALK